MQSGALVFETDLGWCSLILSERGLRYLSLPRGARDLARREAEDRDAFALTGDPVARDLARRVQRLLAGRRVDFGGVPVDWSGYPPFWQAAWSTIRGIPWGQTLAYGEVAALARRPRAARAVGTAVAHNPTAFVVPCHRVIAAGGQLGGYGGEEALKLRLLRMEGWRQGEAGELPASGGGGAFLGRPTTTEEGPGEQTTTAGYWKRLPTDWPV